MKKMWKNLAQFLLALSLIAMSFQTAYAADFFDETFGNLQDELATAKEQDKQGIFLFFEMEECPFCDRMKKTIMVKPEVIAYFKTHFLTYKIDIEGANTLIDFDGTEGTSQSISEKKYRVRATPVMMFFDLEGNPIVRYTGPTKTDEEFMLLGKFVVEGIYKEMSFTKYKRSAASQASVAQ